MQSQTQNPTEQRIEIIRSKQRGKTKIGWLDSKHSFSFGGYHDPRRMGVGPLRVLNDDWVAPGQGFGEHPHRDMEIMSMVLKGELRHQDSTGHGGVIRPGEVQFMRAGRGVTHSEMNNSKTQPVEFVQVWIVPEHRATEPAYDQREIQLGPDWTTIASQKQAGIQIDQDAKIVAAKVDVAKLLAYDLAPGRVAYVFVVEGSVKIGTETLGRRDAATIAPGSIRLEAATGTHVLLFDVPAWGDQELSGAPIGDDEDR